MNFHPLVKLCFILWVTTNRIKKKKKKTGANAILLKLHFSWNVILCNQFTTTRFSTQTGHGISWTIKTHKTNYNLKKRLESALF